MQILIILVKSVFLLVVQSVRISCVPRLDFYLLKKVENDCECKKKPIQ